MMLGLASCTSDNDNPVMPTDEAQLSAFISQIRALNGSPLLCIDEEGGSVARIGNNANFNVEKFKSMEAIGDTGDPQNAYHCGHTIGTYLHR